MRTFRRRCSNWLSVTRPLPGSSRKPPPEMTLGAAGTGSNGTDRGRFSLSRHASLSRATSPSPATGLGAWRSDASVSHGGPENAAAGWELVALRPCRPAQRDRSRGVPASPQRRRCTARTARHGKAPGGSDKPASQTQARGPDKGILVASSGLGQSQFRFEPPNRRAGTPDVSAELVRIVSGVSAERLLPSLQLAPGFQELGLDNRGRAVVAGCHQGRT